MEHEVTIRLIGSVEAPSLEEVQARINEFLDSISAVVSPKGNPFIWPECDWRVVLKDKVLVEYTYPQP